MVETIRDKCVGCKVCGEYCPNKAITFKVDDDGFEYPVVDKEKCVLCGICVKKCPIMTATEMLNKNQPTVYAAWVKDENIRQESTSGGVFYAVASKIIKDGGCVVGAVYNSGFRTARHVIVDNEIDLHKIMGSKYFQSDMEGIYSQIQEKLLEGKKILFCGTPCQNDAVLKAVGEKRDNLILVDFICNAINSPLAFERFLEWNENKYNSKVKNVRLKDKTYGWQSLGTKIEFENGKRVVYTKNNDWWIRGFVKYNLYARKSCYHCQYRTIPRRNVDITIGDFWGIQNQQTHDMMSGISAVLVNTDKGQRLFDSCRDLLEVQEHDLKEVEYGNPKMFNDPPYSSGREKFFKLLNNYPFDEAVKKSLEKEKKFSLIDELANLRKYNENNTLDVKKYIYLNFFCKNIIREGNGKIIPYKNTVFELHSSSRLLIYGDNDFYIGVNKLAGSKAETYFRMARNAIVEILNGGQISYGTNITVKENACLTAGFFTINSNSVVAIDRKITFGEDVMIGRNNLIYDSDFHQMLNKDGKSYNESKEVYIGNHVWITNNVTILKGVNIGNGALICGNTVVNKSVPAGSLVGGDCVGKVIKDEIRWERKAPIINRDIYEGKKVILYGYGKLGKEFLTNFVGNLECIIDNNVKGDNILTFKEFVKKYKVIDDDMAFVISNGKYFGKMCRDIENRYPNALIFSTDDK